MKMTGLIDTASLTKINEISAVIAGWESVSKLE